MGFDENHPRKPFYGFVMIYCYFRRKAAQRKAARMLQRMSQEQLRDIGLTKDDISHLK